MAVDECPIHILAMDFCQSEETFRIWQASSGGSGESRRKSRGSRCSRDSLSLTKPLEVSESLSSSLDNFFERYLGDISGYFRWPKLVIDAVDKLASYLFIHLFIHLLIHSFIHLSIC